MDDFENIEQGEKSSIYEIKRTYCGVEGTLQAVPAFSAKSVALVKKKKQKKQNKTKKKTITQRGRHTLRVPRYALT